MNSDHFAVVCWIILYFPSVIFITEYLDTTRADITTFTFSYVATVFSHQAYLFTKEKFRLGLIDKRLEVYESFMDLCRNTQKLDMINPEDRQKILLMDCEFRRKYTPKIKYLFGPEIHALYDEYIDSCTWLETHTSHEDTESQNKEEWQRLKTQHKKTICKIYDAIPLNFDPYLYFGNFKK